MLFKRFCCTDLKTGIYRYAVTMVVLAVISALTSLFYKDSTTEVYPRTGYYRLVYTVIHAAVIAATVVLAFGAKKENRKLLLPYLIVQGIVLTSATVLCGIFVFQAPVLICTLLVCAFLWYVWLCVLSFYQSLNPNNPKYLDQSQWYEDCPQKGMV